jgi:hypothetical protein
MLKAFSVPITPQGKSALATLPPWHYSSDCIAIEYWADPAAIAPLLPLGLQPDEKSGGRAFFWFLDWQFTGANDELTDPARYQYREAFALVEAIFDGTPVPSNTLSDRMIHRSGDSTCADHALAAKRVPCPSIL